MSATYVGWCATRPENAPKTYEKPFQNDVRTLPKSMLKTSGLSTSIFSGLGFDLGRSWALPSVSWAPLGRSWAALGRSWAALGPVLGASLVLLGASWRSNEAPGSIFKAFGRLWEAFWKLPGLILRCFFWVCGVVTGFRDRGGVCRAGACIYEGGDAACWRAVTYCIKGCSPHRWPCTGDLSSSPLVRRSVRSTWN